MTKTVNEKTPTINKTRPKFLQLTTLAPKMSITAKVSIIHRITGLLLFLAIPFILYVLDSSLTNIDFYSALYGIFALPIIKIIYLTIIAAFIYHMCAGVRFLLLDINIGTNKKTAQLTSKIVILVSILISVLLGALIW